MSLISKALGSIHFVTSEAMRVIKWKEAYYPANKLAASFLHESKKLSLMKHHVRYVNLCTDNQVVPRGMLIKTPITLGSTTPELVREIRALDYQRSIHTLLLFKDFLPKEAKDLRNNFFKLRSILKWNLSPSTYNSLWTQAKSLNKKYNQDLIKRRMRKLDRDIQINNNIKNKYEIVGTFSRQTNIFHETELRKFNNVLSNTNDEVTPSSNLSINSDDDVALHTSSSNLDDLIVPSNSDVNVVDNFRIDKAIEEICGKSTGHGSFSRLAAVTGI